MNLLQVLEELQRLLKEEGPQAGRQFIRDVVPIELQKHVTACFTIDGDAVRIGDSPFGGSGRSDMYVCHYTF